MTLKAVEVSSEVPVVVGVVASSTLPWSQPASMEFDPPEVFGEDSTILSVTMPSDSGGGGGLDVAFKNMVTGQLGVIDARLGSLEEAPPPTAEPTGPAGGDLGGEYPNPSFAQPMARQVDLDTGLGGKAQRYSVRNVSGNASATVAEFILANATTGPLTITPPSNATDGDFVFVAKSDTSTNSVFWDGATNSDANAELVGQWSGATFVKAGSIWIVHSVNISYSAAGAGVGTGTGLTREQADARYDLLGAAQSAANAITKASIGLGNVANTAPADLPISDAVAAALATKANQSSAITVSSGGTVTLNAASGNYQAITATGNVVLAPPTNGADQQGMRIEVFAPSGSTRTVTTTGGISNGSGLPLPLTIQSGRFAILGLVYSARAGRWMLLSYTVEP